MLKWSVDRPDSIWVKTPKDVRTLKELLANTEMAAIDTETTGLDNTRDTVIFWSMSTGNNRFFLERKMLEEFRPVLEDPKRVWVGTHIKFDAHMLANSGIKLEGDLICTLVMDRMLDTDNDHGLKEAYEREFNERMAPFNEVFYPKNKKGKPYKPHGVGMPQMMMEAFETNRERVIDYASLDAYASLRLYKRLKKQLQNVTAWTGESLWDIYVRWEMPFTKVLLKCECNGVQIDIDYLKSLKPKIETEMSKAEKKLNQAAGDVVNIKSPQQLVRLFYKKMKLKPIKWTSGGTSGIKNPSVDVTVLQTHAAEGVEAAKIILRHRKLTKIKGTYIDGIIDRCVNGRLHTTLNQHVTETSRLSSTEPNLQNIPRSMSDEFLIRKAFIAKPGYKFATSDYDQLEMFLMAHFSGDEGMIANILDGKDIHAGTAALVWEEPYEDIVKAKKKDEKEHTTRDKRLLEYRQFAKIVGFGLNYGKGPKRLASELNIPRKIAAAVEDRVLERNPRASKDDIEKAIMWAARDEAQKVIDRYFSKIPGVRDFIELTHQRVAEDKYVESIIGRRRWLRQVMDNDDQIKHQRLAEEEGKTACWCGDCAESRAGDRQSVNTIIQGSAADVTQAAMIECFYDPQLSDVNMLFQVHDEVCFEIPEEVLDDALARIKTNMENPGIQLRVPLKSSPGAGNNWIEAK